MAKKSKSKTATIKAELPTKSSSESKVKSTPKVSTKGNKADIDVTQLLLDQKNYRTLSKKTQEEALKALIEIDPDRFWALLESLLEGYDATEQIVVQFEKENQIVKEGNRRIAAIKLILGHLSSDQVPADTQTKINELTQEIRTELTKVPCLVFQENQTPTVRKIIARTHARDEKAGRSAWPSIAKSRFERDQLGKPSPELALFEAYLENGGNIKRLEIAQWAADYPITVLGDAIGYLSKHFKSESTADFAATYPRQNKALLEKLMHDIGTKDFKFKDARAPLQQWNEKYGLKFDSSSAASETDKGHKTSNTTSSSTTSAPAGSKDSKPAASRANSKTKDPISPGFIKSFAKNLKINGKGKEKAKRLLDELAKLDVEKTPHTFCMLLRSIFEHLAKYHCKALSISPYEPIKDPKEILGNEKTLVEKIEDVIESDPKKRTANQKNLAKRIEAVLGGEPKKRLGNEKSLAKKLEEVIEGLKKRIFPGREDTNEAKNKWAPALKEIKNQHTVLSVRSMNDVVHNDGYIVDPKQLRTSFFNMTCLLQDLCEQV